MSHIFIQSAYSHFFEYKVLVDKIFKKEHPS